MNRPTAGVLRALRSAVVTVVIVGLAVVAHVAGGGHVPSGLAAAAVVVLVASVVHLATRWRLSLAGLTVLLAGGQWLLHESFMALDFARSGPLDVEALNAMPMGQLAHGHSTTPTMSPGLMSPEAMASMHDVATGVSVGSWSVTPMLLAHVVATALTALVLASGERALWRLWSWLAPLVAVLMALVLPVAVRLPRPSAGAFQRWGLREPVRSRSLSRRGPPVLVLCV
ncbi:hypothetical protein [Kineococcus sp. R86509]|uniref:hypothetical protein n=1 Tax=Kineococcus sp. R86509 TaxID=3093851 RepID=UPI0036D3D64A